MINSINTYPNKKLYHPDRVRHLIENGGRASIMAQDQENHVVTDHYAIEVYGRPRAADCCETMMRKVPA